MKKVLISLLFALASLPALAAGSNVNSLSASPAIVATQLLYCPISNTNDYKCTFTQVDAFVNSQFSGDLSATGPGVATVTLTGNHSLTSGFTAGQLTYSDGSKLQALGLGTATTVFHGNASGVGTWGAVNLATDVTGILPVSINAQTGTTYTVLAADQGKLVTFSNSGAVAVTLPQATGATFGAGYSWTAQNVGAGAVTITPISSTINGAATLVLNQNQGVTIVSDGANWQIANGGIGGAFPAPAGTSSLPGASIGTTAYGMYQGTNKLGFSVAGSSIMDYGVTTASTLTIPENVGVGSDTYKGAGGISYYNTGSNPSAVIVGSFSNNYATLVVWGTAPSGVSGSPDGAEIGSGDCYLFGSLSSSDSNPDSALCREGAGVLEAATSTSLTGGSFEGASFISGGAKPTYALSGGTCAGTVTAGGATAGTITLTGVCASTNTLTLTVMPTAPTGYACEAGDRTAPATLVMQTASSTTGATFTFSGSTSGATDVIRWACQGY